MMKMFLAAGLYAVMAVAQGQNTQAREPKKVRVQLDWPAADRWNFTHTDPFYNDFHGIFKSYVTSFVPAWLYPALTFITGHMKFCFQEEYVQEMEGLAKGLGGDIGDIVLENIFYQLSGIGASECKHLNTTGPCLAEDLPENLLHEAGDGVAGSNWCTSAVAKDANGAMWQVRNLDWNLDQKLWHYIQEVDFYDGDKFVFTGVNVAGQIGV